MHSEQPASSAFSPVGTPQLNQVSNLPEINLFSQLAPFYQQGQQGVTAQQLQLWQQVGSAWQPADGKDEEWKADEGCILGP